MSQPNKPSESNSPPTTGTGTGTGTETELTEEDLEQVAGGVGFSVVAQRGITQDVTTNKAKTADKAYTQMDGYIKQ